MNVYKLTDKDGKTRVVEAKNKTAAINHVYAPLVSTLKPAEVVSLMRDGKVEVEEAA